MKRQRGAALLVILLIVGALGAYFAIVSLNNGQAERDQQTANTLAQAKEALIGFAATYPDLHANQVFGLLPCPDTAITAVTGIASPSCGIANESQVGRLPWSTLGLPPLRDSGAECLWYVVSGTSKDNPPTAGFNWDTVGQFMIQNATTPTPVTLAGATPHERPLAIILAPRAPIAGQTRAGPASECGGPIGPGTNLAYLEGAVVSPAANAISTITVSTSDSVRNGTNNDMGLWVTSRDIFDRVAARENFRDRVHNLMDHLVAYAKTSPPATYPLNKGIDNLIAGFLAVNGTTTYALGTPERTFLINWQDNLLYTRPAGPTTVNGTSCAAVLIFSGRRTPAQSRATAAERQMVSNYLEGTNATIFPGPGAYSGSLGDFDAASPTTDLLRCINATTVTTVSFANDFSTFTPVGSGVSVNGATRSVGVTNGPTASGGCFWFPLPIPLSGKTMRTYYEFQFMIADDSALTGHGNDRGNGFTFQVLNAGVGSPPTTCGTESNMGALGSSDSWGAFSFIFETDVRQDSSLADPAANHSAIMRNGSLNHSLSGSMSAACNGTAGGCFYSPANKFEELPTPSLHNQRIEITTGCNASCTTCNPASHVAPNTYARLTAWVDCTSCNDVTSNLDRITKVPTMQRCELLDSSLNSFYFGFTGGFRNGSGAQGVTIRNLRLQTD